MKTLKIKTEIELIPAIVIGAGVDDSKGLVIMLPFVCITIGRIKPMKKHLQPVASRHKGVDIKNTPRVTKTMHDEMGNIIRDSMAKQIIGKF